MIILKKNFDQVEKVEDYSLYFRRGYENIRIGLGKRKTWNDRVL